MPNDLQSFTIEIPVNSPKAMEEFSNAMNDYQDELVKYIEQLAINLNISDSCAMDVYYLRTRSRWTEELENKLIQLHRAGTPPNMCEYPNP